MHTMRAGITYGAMKILIPACAALLALAPVAAAQPDQTSDEAFGSIMDYAHIKRIGPISLYSKQAQEVCFEYKNGWSTLSVSNVVEVNHPEWNQSTRDRFIQVSMASWCPELL
ncbi:hypothetical protein PROPHIGD54-2_3 [Mycobacterium phage prophiGD54-2]|nr:hypothetical protein PROPHIGD54-2_3 [Mycobacterium phage prophiGD54-2]